MQDLIAPVNVLAFTDVTITAGTGDAGGAYGIAWEDYDNDGHLDLWIADYADASSVLYKNNRSAVMGAIHHKIIGTDMIAVSRA